MGIKSKNDERTVYERTSKTGKKHLVVRPNKKEKELGEAADREIYHASKKLDRDLDDIDREIRKLK
jgi:hypothetical protein